MKRNYAADLRITAHVEAKDLLALMDFLDIGEANIVGHSYGAFTALLFALNHPGRVYRLNKPKNHKIR